jgi:hypothetical protein
MRIRADMAKSTYTYILGAGVAEGQRIPGRTGLHFFHVVALAVYAHFRDAKHVSERMNDIGTLWSPVYPYVLGGTNGKTKVLGPL